MLRATAAQEQDLPQTCPLMGAPNHPRGEICTVSAVQPFAIAHIEALVWWSFGGSQENIPCLPAKDTALHRQWSHILETP